MEPIIVVEEKGVGCSIGLFTAAAVAAAAAKQ